MNSIVVESDWDKVLPLIRDDAFSVQVVPVESSVRPLDSVTRLSSSTVDARDPLFARVYGTLALLFPEKVPT